uniref:Proctolin n=2 Tax=Bursaphelenchus xylophilus TaxID=6326 RepID=A0A1I7SI45_BURXY
MKPFVVVLPLLVAAASAEHDLEELERVLSRLDRSVQVNLNINLHSALPSLPDILGLREDEPHFDEENMPRSRYARPAYGTR